MMGAPAPGDFRTGQIPHTQKSVAKWGERRIEAVRRLDVLGYLESREWKNALWHRITGFRGTGADRETFRKCVGHAYRLTAKG